MRHRNIKSRLNRNTSNRLSMLKNMSVSLIKYEQIRTTLVRAKVLRRYFEPLITIAKIGSGSLASRRKLISILPEYKAVIKLIDVLAKRYASRNGGYTRILRSGFRQGDGAPVAYIELVDRDRSAKDQIVKHDEINKEEVKV
jgi:large subunit ribosomal protein L17